MKTQNYNSFVEIDKQLKILELQKKIAFEEVKLDWHKSKKSLYPSHILNHRTREVNLKGVLQNILVNFIFEKIIKKLFKNKSQ